MFVYLLNLTTGTSFTKQHGMQTVPKKIVTQLGTFGFRQLDGRISRLATAISAATELMRTEKNKIGYAIYRGTIDRPQLIFSSVEKPYEDLELDIENA